MKGVSVTNSWSSVSGADSYIYESYHNAAATDVRWTQPITGTSKTATNVSDTTFWWRVKAVRADGVESKWSELRNVTVDSTRPTVSLTLQDGTFIRGNATITGTAGDATSGVGQVRWGVWAVNDDGSQGVKVKGWTDAQSYDNATGEWTAQLSGLSEGAYRIQAKAFDRANNNSKAATVDVIVDNTAPTITVKDNYVGDKDGNVFSSVSFKLHDTHRIDKFALNGTMVDRTNSVWGDANFQNIKHLLVEGANTFTLYDVAGNSSSYGFIYDSVMPELTVSVSPEWTVGDKVEVHATATDEVSKVAQINYVITGPVTRTCVKKPGAAQSPLVRSCEKSDLPAGDYTVTVTATDVAGNVSATQTAAFTVSTSQGDDTTDSEEDSDNNSGADSNEAGRDSGNNQQGRSSSNTLRNTAVNVSQSAVVVSGFTDVITLPGATIGQESDDSEALREESVLGAQTERDATTTASQAAVVSTDGDGKIFGMMWHWWLAVLAVIIGAWWIVAAVRRRKSEDQA